MKKWICGVVICTLAGMYGFKKPADGPPQSGKDKRPNIVLILADDMGYSDLGCFGGEVHTPHLDYLAKNGVRFTRFYNTSRCCPTRASLLTGLYNHSAGIGEMTEDRREPGYRGHITGNTVTLAEVLKAAGYHTGMSGKWHVSNTVVQSTREAQMDWLNHQVSHPAFSPLEQYPVNRGFEKYFGNIWGVVDYFDPFSLVSGTTPIENIPEHYYHTDAINDTAVAYIRSFSRESKPFFLYVAHTAPHWPLQAPPEDIEKYKDTYKSGWEAIRQSRYKRMTEMGLIDPHTAPMSPSIEAEQDWNSNPHQAWDARAMAVHAAMIDRMDQGIGRIIETLKQTGELDNTIILFLSDNGASAEDASRYGPGFDRPGTTRDGKKIIYPVNKGVLPGPQTIFASIGRRWANVANTPFRSWKSESYEGGVHTPMIAFWPKGITLPKGSITRQTGHVMDFMATFVELAETTYPTKYNGKDIPPTQGISLLPVLKGRQWEGHEVLCNEHYGARYIRTGPWKMVAGKKEAWRLYSIADDETELNDLSARYPAEVRRLDSIWNDWAHANHVLPKKTGR